MKRKLTKLNAALCLVLAQSAAHAGAGNLFNVSASGTPGTISFTLCLNAKAQLSCQVYTVNALTLSITTALNHAYPDAGIKITTPGYTPTGCTPIENGFCSFAASNTSTTTINVKNGSSGAAILTAVGRDSGSSHPLLVASTNSGSIWKVMTDPVFATDGQFNASSCTGSGATALCTAAGHSVTGDHPLLAVSQDGSATWSLITSGLPSSGQFNSTSCTGSGATAVCVASGEDNNGNGTIVVSTDGGANWVGKSVSGTTSPNSLKGTSTCIGSGSSAICVAVGEDDINYPNGFPLVAVSTNGGVDWSAKSVAGLMTAPVGHFNAASCTGSGASAICTAVGVGDSAPVVAVSSDGGANWAYKPVSGGLTSSGEFHTTSCTGSGATAVCVAAGEDSNSPYPPIFAVSVNGGADWAVQNTFSGDYPNYGRFVSSSCVGSVPNAVCAVAGYRGSDPYYMMAVSIDGGVTWAMKTVANALRTGELVGVSCTGSGATAVCTAAGDYYNPDEPFLTVSVNGGVDWTAVVGANFGFPTSGQFFGSGATSLAKKLHHEKFGARHALEGIMQQA